ncbi:chorismate mutase [Alkalicoccobacillus murimartini]|uniref:chorismate mutase n=1 Tax=Alkalicoccobacillus murimartini TaxID=171685 RepID=A0ABT9YEE9_9BACI|nr:chorismate mutase [Alkalicoccobacillus murimartini]MDQ0205921.1 chorismate mutase [Alkalicoccobacillus murimartini]
MVRGIRGATTVTQNEERQILDVTEQLFKTIAEQNEINPEDVAQVLITVTGDLNAAFPAKAMRRLTGWDFVPVTCAQEIDVPGGLPFCIRALLTINTEKSQKEIEHIYLNDAVKLRPDLVRVK